MRKTDTVFRYALLIGAFLLGCLVAMGTSQALGQNFVVVQQPATVTTQEVTATPVVRSRVFTRTAPVLMQTEPRVLFSQPARPVFSVVRAEPPTYSIVETPSAPFVRSGLFRDRIVQPRRNVLTIERQ